MKPTEILKRLKKIAKMDGSFRDPFICCDLVGQEELFKLQDEFSKLMLEIAESIGDTEVRLLAKSMPYIYTINETDA